MTAGLLAFAPHDMYRHGMTACKPPSPFQGNSSTCVIQPPALACGRTSHLIAEAVTCRAGGQLGGHGTAWHGTAWRGSSWRGKLLHWIWSKAQVRTWRDEDHACRHKCCSGVQ